MTWRTGTKNPHALYKDDQPAGFVRDAEDGKAIVEAMSGRVYEERSMFRDAWQAATLAHDAALARARELEDPLREQTWAERFRVLTERAEQAEQKLAEANALLERWMAGHSGTWLSNHTDTKAHLAAQPAAPACEHDWCFESGPGELELCRKCGVHR